MMLQIISVLSLFLHLGKGDVPLTPDNVCLPNPPVPSEYLLSPPFATCQGDVLKSLAPEHPDQNKDTGEIFQTYGYPYKVYNVTTTDGYILTVFRITGSPNRTPDQNEATKQAVFLMHGLTMASDCWNFQPGSRNLPFKLADAGYEVWLGNARGTSYSLGHTKWDYNLDWPKYWNFDWHEMGIYDLPAVTDKILAESGNSKITFVGHSMGTTQFLVSLSEIPEMNNKFHAAFLLAPIAFMGHSNSVQRLGMPAVANDEIYKVVNAALLGRVQIPPVSREKLNLTFGDVCDLTAAKCGVCDNLEFAAFGYNAPQMNNSELPNMFAKVLNSFSVKVLAHYGQSGTFCQFKQYDYGWWKNIWVYGRFTPPEYQLNKITTPLYFFYGEHDNLGPPNDAAITASKLAPGVLKGMYKVNESLFTHPDFLLAKDADTLVYNKILDIIQLYN